MLIPNMSPRRRNFSLSFGLRDYRLFGKYIKIFISSYSCLWKMLHFSLSVISLTWFKRIYAVNFSHTRRILIWGRIFLKSTLGKCFTNLFYTGFYEFEYCLFLQIDIGGFFLKVNAANNEYLMHSKILTTRQL